MHDINGHVLHTHYRSLVSTLYSVQAVEMQITPSGNLHSLRSGSKTVTSNPRNPPLSLFSAVTICSYAPFSSPGDALLAVGTSFPPPPLRVFSAPQLLSSSLASSSFAPFETTATSTTTLWFGPFVSLKLQLINTSYFSSNNHNG